VGGEFVERVHAADAENALFFIPSAREDHSDVRSCRIHPDAA